MFELTIRNYNLFQKREEFSISLRSKKKREILKKKRKINLANADQSYDVNSLLEDFTSLTEVQMNDIEEVSKLVGRIS